MKGCREAYQSYLAHNQGASLHTVKAYGADIGQFERFLELKHAGIESWRQVEPAHVRLFLAELLKERRRSTVARKLQSLRGFFGFLLDRGDVAANPAAMVRPPKQDKPLPRRLSVDEAFHLLESPGHGHRTYGAEEQRDACRMRDRAMLELLYSSGLRVSELVGLDLDHLDLEAGLVRVVRGKGAKDRVVPVGQKARAALGDWIKDRLRLTPQEEDGVRALFLNRRGGRLTQRSVQRMLGEHLEGLEVGRKIGPHTLRHAMATHMLEGGGDLRSVQEMLGHKSLSTTQKYTHLTVDHLLKVYDKAHPRAGQKTPKGGDSDQDE